MSFVPGEWERCGNTVFYKKMRPHDRVGYVHVNPAEFVMVRWEDRPEGYVIDRLEVPADLDWASKELVRFSVDQLPPEVQKQFSSWTSILDILIRHGDSPSVIVGHFHNGYEPHQRNQVLDAIDQGVFAADVKWLKETKTVDMKEELEAALADFGVLECPEESDE